MVNQSSIRLAVLGHPIRHSLSPILHDWFFKQAGIAGSYEKIDTPPEKLAETLNTLQQQGYAGVNLTLPLKEQALPLLDKIDPIAKQIGAVNTVIFKDGKKIGYNTDAYGFMQNLQDSGAAVCTGVTEQGDARSGGGSLVMGVKTPLDKIIILGAGGAARAVIAGLLDAGAQEIIICNRNQQRAEELATINHQLTTTHWNNRHKALENASLLVNTTSLGMQGQPKLEISLEALPKTALVADIVYQPLETELLLAARHRGNPACEGVGMLVYQGQKAFELFTGLHISVTKEVYNLLHDHLRTHHPKD